MGTKSDVYIAINGKKYITESLANKLPEVLIDKSKAKERQGAFYFLFENVNWFLKNTKIHDLRIYLKTLDDEDYGLMALHEDEIGATEQGDTYRYDLYIYRRMNNEIRKLFSDEAPFIDGRSGIQNSLIDKRIQSKQRRYSNKL